VPTTLTPGDGQDLFARYKWARERRDPDRALELFSEDAEVRPDPFEPPLAGALAIREHWNAVVASQVHVEFDAETVWVAGRTVLCSWHGAYTRRRNGDRIRQRGFMTAEVDGDGLVARLRSWTLEQVVGTDGTFEPEADAVTGEEGEDGR
jgi:ketosteroid isomerase-like protein